MLMLPVPRPLALRRYDDAALDVRRAAEAGQRSVVAGAQRDAVAALVDLHGSRAGDRAGVVVAVGAVEVERAARVDHGSAGCGQDAVVAAVADLQRAAVDGRPPV